MKKLQEFINLREEVEQEHLAETEVGEITEPEEITVPEELKCQISMFPLKFDEEELVFWS